MFTKAAAASPTWPREPGTGRGRSHGTSGVEPFDRWFRYPAGFASDYVQILLDRLCLDEGTVLDCFTGSGVTGTAARARGLDFAGIEAHPMVAELAQLKLSPTTDGPMLRGMASKVTKQLQDHKHVSPLADEQPELIRRSFTAETLTTLLSLRQLVVSMRDETVSAYLKWALLGTLRDVAAVKVGWPYQRPGVPRKPRSTDVLGRFTARAVMMAEDIDAIAGSTTRAEVVVGDARDPKAWIGLPAAVQACVASPPYLNNFDYADATRLEAYFWGTATTWRELCDEIRSDMLTATTQQSSVREKTDALAMLASMGGAAPPEIARLVDDISAAKRDRNRRSKEYDQVAPAYFLAMSQVLANVATHLEPDGHALWLIGDSAPYGVYVDTPRLIGELAADCGLVVEDDVPLRERGNRWGSNSDRHQVQLSERLLVMRRARGPAAGIRLP